MTKRKIVSWRVSDHTQSDLINDWLDEQRNIQESITNVVLHMINRFGVRNVTDFDIQKVLYQEGLGQTLQSQEKEIDHLDEDITKVENTTEDNSTDEDDPFAEVESSNL